MLAAHVFLVTDGWLHISALLLASLMQLDFCSDMTSAYEPFFTGSHITCLGPSLADAIEAEVLPIP